MKKIILLLILLFGTIQLQAQKKKSKTVKKTNTQKTITQAAPFATLSSGNNYTINTVCVSPDGQQILSSGDDGAVRIWDIATKIQTNIFSGDKNSVGAVWPSSGVAYSYDGKTFISGQKNSVPKLYDITTSNQIKKFHKGGVAYSFEFSPNGNLIALGHYGSVSISETNSSNVKLIPISKTGNIISVAFSPDSQSLVSVSENQEISLWDLNSGSKMHNFDIHNYVKDVEYANDAAFTPDGKTIITGGFNKEPYQGIIKIWNVNDGTLIRTIIDGQSIDCVAISHDGQKLATGNFDHSLKIWEIATGKLLKEFIGHKSYIKSVVFSPDDKTLVSSGNGGIINLWKVN